MKKFLSLLLALSVLFCLGSVAFAAEYEVGPNEVVDVVNEDDIVTKIHNGGIVGTNNGTVNLNEGIVNLNNGRVVNNSLTGNVKNNASNGTISENNGPVTENYGLVSTNTATGTVLNQGDGAEVDRNFGTVFNGAPDETKDDKGYIYYATGNKAVIGITYDEGQKDSSDKKDDSIHRQNVLTTYTVGETYIENPASVALMAPESEVEGKKPVWEDSADLQQYEVGEIVQICFPKRYTLLWVNYPSGSSQNADYFYADYNGVYEGKTFLMNQPLENFENVSCNGAYLEKGTDYIVEADGTMTRVTFTAKFFEKFGNGPVPVAPLFHGAVYCLVAVNK